MPVSYITVVVVVGIVLGLILIPMVLRSTKPIASPYPAADRINRYVGGFVDLAIAVGLYAAIAPKNSVLAATVGSTYALCRDGLSGGQSLGKMCVGQVVIQLKSGNRGQVIDSVRRNIIFAVPGMNLVAIPFELTQLANDGQGIRIGDRMASTQVVDGKDAKDLITFVKEILASLADELRGRDHTPR